MLLNTNKIVLIDLDGTLVDTLPDLAWCIDEMMRSLNLPICGNKKVRNWIGGGVPRLIERASAEQSDGHHLGDGLVAKASLSFMELYAENLSKRSRLYPDIKEGLQWLIDHGIRIGCVTNKDEQFTLPILKNLGVFHYFEIVISGDTLPLKKPDPAQLLHGAEFFGIAPKDGIMIGDSVNDVNAARAAGFGIICLSYGYNHGIDIRTMEPDLIIDSFKELEGYFSI